MRIPVGLCIGAGAENKGNLGTSDGQKILRLLQSRHACRGQHHRQSFANDSSSYLATYTTRLTFLRNAKPLPSPPKTVPSRQRTRVAPQSETGKGRRRDRSSTTTSLFSLTQWASRSRPLQHGRRNTIRGGPSCRLGRVNARARQACGNVDRDRRAPAPSSIPTSSRCRARTAFCPYCSGNP